MTMKTETASELMRTRLVQRAALFAQFAHYGQRRKFGDEPYFFHPLRVAWTVAEDQRACPVHIAAALLHDVMEDCGIGHADLVHYFGAHVANIVDELTDKYTKRTYPEWNRARRKRAEADRLAQCGWDVRMIKRADIADNTRDIEQFDPGFAKVYREEKDYLLYLFDISDRLDSRGKR